MNTVMDSRIKSVDFIKDAYFVEFIDFRIFGILFQKVMSILSI